MPPPPHHGPLTMPPLTMAHAVRQILDKGLDPNISNADGLTPLHKVSTLYTCLPATIYTVYT